MNKQYEYNLCLFYINTNIHTILSRWSCAYICSITGIVTINFSALIAYVVFKTL